jgi:hypothetical protein
MNLMKLLIETELEALTRSIEVTERVFGDRVVPLHPSSPPVATLSASKPLRNAGETPFAPRWHYTVGGGMIPGVFKAMRDAAHAVCGMACKTRSVSLVYIITYLISASINSFIGSRCYKIMVIMHVCVG